MTISSDRNDGLAVVGRRVAKRNDRTIIHDEVTPHLLESVIESSIGPGGPHIEIGVEIGTMICRRDRVLVLPCLA